MEVAGNPHYENVSSNILAFYFDPYAEHGLKGLLITAALKMAGIKELPLLGEREVVITRECGTDEGKRIDLIISGEAFVIAIENKIHHWVANDLEEYARAIANLGSKKDVVKAVLGLHRVHELKGGFTSYTYSELWKQVRALIGDYIANAHPKWVTYLIDFMETTANLAGENVGLRQRDQFFIEHNALIEKLITERNDFLRRLNQKVSDLWGMLSAASEAAALSAPPYIWRDSCLVLDFQFANARTISFDLYLQPRGWELQLFGRNTAKNSAYLRQLISHPALHSRASSAPIRNGRYIVQHWDIKTDLRVICDALRGWMNAMAMAGAEVHPIAAALDQPSNLHE